MKNSIKFESLVYSNIKENSNKYYIIEIIEEDSIYSLILRYGRLGKVPQIKKEEGTEKFLIGKYNKKISDLLKKGYKKAPLEIIINNNGEFL